MEVGIRKECVTTHQSNGIALKMDYAETGYLYLTVDQLIRSLATFRGGPPPRHR